jgi:hypothetical protein
MQAWQKHAIERRRFLGRLRDSILVVNGEDVSDTEILNFSCILLETIIEERCGHIETTNPHIVSVIEQINGFARLPAEASDIKHRLLKMLLREGFREASSNLLQAGVHEQERLYNGHRATDEVD